MNKLLSNLIQACNKGRDLRVNYFKILFLHKHIIENTLVLLTFGANSLLWGTILCIVECYQQHRPLPTRCQYHPHVVIIISPDIVKFILEENIAPDSEPLG